MTSLEHKKIRRRLKSFGWFNRPGVYALVDGQYGSTGKGLVSAFFAELMPGEVDWNITNNGPNSGHTFYVGNEKHVLKQLPTYGVAETLTNGWKPHSSIYLTNGAIIDQAILEREIKKYKLFDRVFTGPNCVFVQPEHIENDRLTTDTIASTGQGTGPALASKILRTNEANEPGMEGFFDLKWRTSVIYMEIPQGFSLGVNSGFYPHVTSRECTVAQGLSDASLPPSSLRGTVMVVRTYPIRVGNAPNGASSGPCYSDQKEIQWGDLGVDPELTTVTQRQRRIFTWSALQYRQSLLANAPDIIFVNFCNYLTPGEVHEWVKKNVYNIYYETMDKAPKAILLGYGPKSEDIYLWG